MIWSNINIKKPNLIFPPIQTSRDREVLEDWPICEFHQHFRISFFVKIYKYSQILLNDHMSIATTILRSHVELIIQKLPPNNDHLSTTFLGTPRMAVVHKFGCTNLKNK